MANIGSRSGNDPPEAGGYNAIPHLQDERQDGYNHTRPVVAHAERHTGADAVVAQQQGNQCPFAPVSAPLVERARAHPVRADDPAGPSDRNDLPITTDHAVETATPFKWGKRTCSSTLQRWRRLSSSASL